MKELFVFGAGASHASGNTPLGKDLVWTYYEDCSTFYQIGPNGKPAPQDIDDKKREFKAFSHFLKSIKDVFPEISEYDRWIQCMDEAVMHVPRIEKKFYIDEIMKVLQERNDAENILLIKRLTFEHIGKSSLASKNILYETFVRSLKDKPNEDVTVISFNFDSLLHEDYKEKINFDYLIDFNRVDSSRMSYERGVGFPLIKLNGSLDWEWHPYTDEINLLFYHIANTKYNFGTSLPEPYVFLPHQKKIGIIEKLWERSRQEIKSASKITVIGYSFPVYDNDVIALFRNNIKSDVKLKIIDYDWFSGKDQEKEEIAIRKIRRYYKRLFPQVDNIDINVSGFKGYIEEIKD